MDIKKKTSKSILKKYNSVEFFDSFNEEELYHILNWADIGLVPSYFEGYCKVLREFIECGLVPITTDFFGSEIIKDNFNGIVIQKPYYDNMLKSILRLLDDITLLSKYKKSKCRILLRLFNFNTTSFPFSSSNNST